MPILNAMQVLSLSRPAVTTVILALYITHPAVTMPYRALFTVGAAFFVATSAIIVQWIPVPRPWLRLTLWAELVAATLLSFAVSRFMPGGPMQILFFPLAVAIFLSAEREHWRWMTIAMVAGWVGSSLPGALLLSPVDALVSLAIYGILLLFASSTSVLMRNAGEAHARSQALLARVNESQAALERTHQQLRESVARQQEVAVLEERQRLAREIHDGVAHALTALVVQLQAGRKLLEHDPPRGLETIARCEEMARGALTETRRAVRALHPAGLEQQSCVTALQRLGRDFSLATGMQISVEADEASHGLPPDPVRVEQLYRIFQEALTNAHRHGHATRVRADLTVADDHLRLLIQNDGERPAHLEPGVGLKSMSERAHAIGATLDLLPQEHGLTVQVLVPLSREVSA